MFENIEKLERVVLHVPAGGLSVVFKGPRGHSALQRSKWPLRT